MGTWSAMLSVSHLLGSHGLTGRYGGRHPHPRTNLLANWLTKTKPGCRPDKRSTGKVSLPLSRPVLFFMLWMSASSAAAQVPGALLNVTARANPERAAVTWTAPDSGGTPSSYNLYRGDGDGCANLSALQKGLAADTTYVDDMTIAADATYCYQMTASNADGEGPGSATAVVSAIAPAGPTSLTVVATRPGAIDLSWHAPEGNAGGPLDGYNVYRCAESATACVPEYYAWVPFADGEGYSDLDVMEDTVYRYAIGASRLGWISTWSNQVTASTGAPVVPKAPTDLIARASVSRVDLSWTAPAGEGIPQSYTLYRGDGDGCANLVAVQEDLPVDPTYAEDMTVTEGGTYCYQVTASNPAGESPRSNGAVVQAVEPGPPTNLAVVSSNDQAIMLDWTAPTDDGGGPLDGYNVYRCEGEQCVLDESSWLAWVPNGTSYTDDGSGEPPLTPATTYRYAVASSRAGTLSAWSNLVTASASGPVAREVTFVWLFPPVSDGVRQGFVRMINHSPEGGEVIVEAIDDAGARREAATLSVDAGQTVHFNSNDLEQGNPAKGFDGIGAGQGDWRLEFSTELDMEALSYIRTTDGFLTAMHDVAPVGEHGHRVVTFNPANNVNQVSRLRLVNPGEQPADATISGVDDAGISPGDGVSVSIPAGGAVTLTSEELESGTGLTGSLGDGRGKWRLLVNSERDIVAMSLLANTGTGHLTNLSTAAPAREAGVHEVLLFPSASDASGRQGFVRVVNRSDRAGEAYIGAFDDTDREFETLTLRVDAGATVHFNSNDLELGNLGKGLSGSTGAGTGDWRLLINSELDLEVLSYMRTGDGFLTAMHDLAPVGELAQRVAILNPGSNRNQASRLRLVNRGEQAADVTIRGIDDLGASPGGEVRFSIPAGAAREYGAAALEAGSDAFEGALGDGAGKWRLRVAADSRVRVMSLLESPTGHLTNLSTTTRNPP